MSNEKQGLGLFINKKASAKPAAAAADRPAAGSLAKPKNVKQRWMLVGGGAAILFVIGSSFLSGNNQSAPAPEKKKSIDASTISVNPPNADKASFESQWSVKFAALNQQVQQLNSQVQAKSKTIEELQQEANKLKMEKGAGTPQQVLPPGVVAPPSMNPAGNSGGLSSTVTPPPPPPLPTGLGVRLPAPSSSGAIPNLAPDLPAATPKVFAAPPLQASSAAGMDAVSTKTRYEKNPAAGMVPAGAFAPVALLNGVDAGTSATTQSNPLPVLMRVTDQATLPGSARYQLKSCFVLGTAYGDLSAERVYVRFSRLSCVDKSDKLILSQNVSGYLVDSDGKLGLRGVVTDRQGAKLGKALLAGFAQGLAGALGQAQSSVLSNLSTGTTTSTIGGSAALRSSGLTGAQTAASQLAQFYLQEAQSVFPVITVDAGRTGTIVFTDSVSLNWENASSKYIKTVKPSNS
jgi:conjugal transfer pilus assembly protein TraB